jgi:hypothetical protein
MSDKRKSKFPGCFKYGCFGCLGLFALVVGLFLLIGAVQLTSDDEPSPEQRQVSHELPGTPELPELAVYGGEDQPLIPEILPLPDGIAKATPGAGQLVLDLAMGEFEIRPGPAGEPIRIEADYDSNAFALTEEFTERDDGTWTYDVGFSAKGGMLGLLFRGGVDGGHNRVVITIPRGYPMEVLGSISMGESEIDLGGLSVSRVDLDIGMGNHFLEFREPLPVPMEEFRLDGSMGEIEVRDLGAASPKVVDVQHEMGEMLVDLKGEWLRDAEVNVNFSMGGCRIWLPDDVHVEIDRASVGLGERRIEQPDQSEIPEDAPTVTIKAAGTMGELRIEG